MGVSFVIACSGAIAQGFVKGIWNTGNGVPPFQGVDLSADALNFRALVVDVCHLLEGFLRLQKSQHQRMILNDAF